MRSPYSMLARAATVVACLVSTLPADEPQPISAELVLMEVPARQAAGDEPGRPAGEVRTVVGDAAALRRLFEMIAERDDAKVLSRPTVVTLPGREANVLVGGEFAVPVLQPNGKWTREPRTFGTKLELVPTIVEDGIHLDLSAEFSERDFANAVTLDGEKVPGLKVRRFHANGSVGTGQAMLQIAQYEDATRIVFVHPQRTTALTP